MVVLGYNRFDFVGVGRENAAIFARVGGAVQKFGFQVIRVPDPVLHAVAAEIDQGDLLRRIQLRDGAHAQPDEEAQIPVGDALNEGVDKSRVLRIIERGQFFGVDIVHRFVVERAFGEIDRRVGAAAYALFPTFEDILGRRGRGRFLCAQAANLRCEIPRVADHEAGQVLVDGGRAGPARKFMLIDGSDRPEAEVPFPYENRAGIDSVHRRKQRQRASLEIEVADVESERHIFDFESVAEPIVSQLHIKGVGIGVAGTFGGDVDAGLLGREDQGEWQIDATVATHRGYQRIEFIARYANRILARLQVGDGKFSVRAGGEADRGG